MNANNNYEDMMEETLSESSSEGVQVDWEEVIEECESESNEAMSSSESIQCESELGVDADGQNISSGDDEQICEGSSGHEHNFSHDSDRPIMDDENIADRPKYREVLRNATAGGFLSKATIENVVLVDPLIRTIFIFKKPRNTVVIQNIAEASPVSLTSILHQLRRDHITVLSICLGESSFEKDINRVFNAVSFPVLKRLTLQFPDLSGSVDDPLPFPYVEPRFCHGGTSQLPNDIDILVPDLCVRFFSIDFVTHLTQSLNHLRVVSIGRYASVEGLIPGRKPDCRMNVPTAWLKFEQALDGEPVSAFLAANAEVIMQALNTRRGGFSAIDVAKNGDRFLTGIGFQTVSMEFLRLISA